MKVSKKWRIAAVVLVGPTLAMMDSTIVSVILPQLQTAFHTDFRTVNWVVSAYFLAQAAVLPVIGYVSDRVGSKVAFLTSLALFTAGSLLCSLSPAVGALIAFRVLQGVGGGALIPLSLAINFRIFPPEERSKVSAILGIPMILAPTFGPTIGGYLSTSWHWNAVFLINVPFGLIDLLLIALILPGRTSNESEQAKGARKSFDVLGLLLSIVGVTTLVYGISEAATKGWGDQIVLAALLIGTAILIIFAVVELRVKDPVLDLRLFKNYTFTIANVLIWLISGSFVGGLFLLPLFLESVRGDTALIVGVFLVSQGLASAVSSTISGLIYNRVGPRVLVLCSLLLIVVGTYGLTQISVNTTGQDLQVWLILRGLGVGIVFQPLQTLVLSVVSNKGMAKASSLVNVTRQVATAVAVAVLTTYLTEQTAAHGVGLQALAAGLADTFWVVMILNLVCIPLALVMGRDPAIEAIRKAKREKADRGEPLSLRAIGQGQEGKEERLLPPQPLHIPTAPLKSRPDVISTLSANGEQIMRPEILLWRYPKESIGRDSWLTVASNQFCVLKSGSAILKTYEPGQYTVPTPADTLSDSEQLTFSGEPIQEQYEVLYINRAKLIGKVSGVVFSREMGEVDYHVEYTLHVATQADAMQLVQQMPSRGQTLSIQDVSAYAGPVIEEAVNQRVQTTSLGLGEWMVANPVPTAPDRGLQMRQDISQRVYQHLQPFLSHYGMTLDMVEVQELRPRNEHIKALISPKAFDLSKLEVARSSTPMTKYAMDHGVKIHQEQNPSIVWQKTLYRYADEIAALQAEFERTRADVSLRMDAHSARLQKVSDAISNDLQASVPSLDRSTLGQG